MSWRIAVLSGMLVLNILVFSLPLPTPADAPGALILLLVVDCLWWQAQA